MKYPFLASSLSLLIGSGIAYADIDGSAPDTATYDTTTTETTDVTHKGDKTTVDTTMKTSEQIQNVDLFFDTASAQLNAGAASDLQALADWAKCDTNNAIILEGHADPRGTANYNLKLSGERAATVRQKLIDLGVPSQRIVVSVFGENGPRKATLAKERRVTARAAGTPVAPSDLAG
jgi:outer membrane protein OmpA-like peptidoglycan-associated protein